MKYRTDFVTNSSSSSFVCDICMEVESGWDIDLSEANFVQCENGHEFCDHHISPSLFNKIIDYEDKNYDEDWRYSLKEKYCPICTFKELSITESRNYLILKNKIDLELLKKELRNEFNNFDEFKKFLSSEGK